MASNPQRRVPVNSVLKEGGDMRALGKVLMLVCAAFSMGACAPLQPVKSEPPKTYALEPRIPVAAGQMEARRTIIVSIPSSAPGYDSSRMAYLRKAYQLEYFAHNEWVDSPANMLGPLLVQALDRSGAFKSVALAPSTAVADLRLDTEIVRLQQEFNAVPSRVRLTVRAQLIDVARAAVLATREFDVFEAAPEDTPYGGVIAANRAFGRVLVQIAEFCAKEAK
jgi:cholesterol transport system auxiliary component